jgi:hypothetical protein
MPKVLVWGSAKEWARACNIFYCRSIKTFVVSSSNHERLVLPACTRSTLRLARGERIQCLFAVVYTGYNS